MLRLTALEIARPGRGEARRSAMLPLEDEVAVLSGAGLGGRTAALSAIRYCAFGSSHQTALSNSQPEDREITLGFRLDDKAYRLCRRPGTDHRAPGAAEQPDETTWLVGADGRPLPLEEARALLAAALPPAFTDLMIIDEAVFQDLGVALHDHKAFLRVLCETAETLLAPKCLLQPRDTLERAVLRSERAIAAGAVGIEKAAAPMGRLTSLLEEQQAAELDLAAPLAALAGARAQRRACLVDMDQARELFASREQDLAWRQRLAFEAAVRDGVLAEAAVREAEVGQSINREYRRHTASWVIGAAAPQLAEAGRRLRVLHELLQLVELGLHETLLNALSAIDLQASRRFGNMAMVPDSPSLICDHEEGWALVDESGRWRSVPVSGMERAVILALVAAVRDQLSPPPPLVISLPEPFPDETRRQTLIRQFRDLGGQVVLVTD